MGYAKKTALIFALLLFIWFLLDITGLSFGSVTLVVSALKDEPIDLAMLVVYAVSIGVFIRFERIGKWLLLLVVAFWTFIQGSMYFTGSFDSYYRLFADEGTHRLFPESQVFLVKDTYHIVLDLLILATLISVIVFIVPSTKRSTRSIRGKKGNEKTEL